MAADPAVKPPTILSTTVPLSVGQLFYRDNKRHAHSCPFQFNPTEIERSCDVKFTRTPTGNTREEPRAGERNQTKRKSSRKPERWQMTLSLKFDAGHPLINKPPPPPPENEAADDDSDAPGPSLTGPTAPRSDKLESSKALARRVVEAMRFFEALAEPLPDTTENDKMSNADETPPPPFLTLALGWRSWKCAVKSVRIKEEDYTYDLYPRRFEVSLTLEIIETTQQVGPAQ
ncbi:MAG: hypothetical protein ABIY55_13715 [Kofleriaceae bacterium]